MNTCTKTIDITKPHTTRDGRPVRDLVRYKIVGGYRIAGIIAASPLSENSEVLCSWPEHGRYYGSVESAIDLIPAPEGVEVTVYYYRLANGDVLACSAQSISESRLIAKRVERVTVGEGLEGGK